MKRALVVPLAICLVFPSLGATADTRDHSAQPLGGSTTHKLKATLISADVTKMQVTYRDESTGALASASLSGSAATQVVELKSGASVNLQLRSNPATNTLVVESIEKRSHKKLLIIGLVLATVVVGSAVIASSGPI